MNLRMGAVALLSLWSTGLLAEGSPNQTADQTEAPIYIFLQDPADTQPAPSTQPADTPPSTPTTQPSAQAATQPATQPSTQPAKKIKSIDDLIKESQEGSRDLTKHQKAIVQKIQKDQKDFIAQLQKFLIVKFDAQDDEAVSEFNTIRAKIVKLVMSAPDQKSFYSRLYMINSIYLEHQDQAARFISLDKALKDKWMETEATRRKIRQIVTGTSMVVGLAIGGFISYKISAKAFSVTADDAGFKALTKYTGRAVVTLVGAGAGAYAGEYLGFLGSEALFRYQRDFIDPVDGTEDLRELLKVVEEL
jgi:hypothetical protein